MDDDAKRAKVSDLLTEMGEHVRDVRMLRAQIEPFMDKLHNGSKDATIINRCNTDCDKLDAAMNKFSVKRGEISMALRHGGIINMNHPWAEFYLNRTGYFERSTYKLLSTARRAIIDALVATSKSAENRVKYIDIIKQLREQKKLNIASCDTEFDINIHDGLLHSDCLCILSDVLTKKIREYCKSNNIRVPGKREILDQLEGDNAIKIYSNGSHGQRCRTVPINYITCNCGRHRFVAITYGY